MYQITNLLCLFLLLIALPLALSAVEPNLVTAFIQVESAGRDNAIGDHGRAYGALQIHAHTVTDVNRLYGTKYHLRDMLDRSKAVEVCQKYLAFYGSEKQLGHLPTTENLARIWNGGPEGWRHKATAGYWRRVHAQLTLP